jgi:hypothetical protein
MMHGKSNIKFIFSVFRLSQQCSLGLFFLGYGAKLLYHRCPTSRDNVVVLSSRVEMSHEEYFDLDETTILS